ncbi:hypothetical protein LTR66_002095 [Elasticomyces elasticus]|nr:hypothetical protein LTR66_002095 [Elasticomyces elasticus]
MFSTTQRGAHSTRKRMLSNVYAKSVLQTCPALGAMSYTILCKRMLPRLAGKAATSTAFEMYELFSAVTMDFVTAYQFGLAQSSDFVRDPKHSAHFLRLFKARQQYTFWPQELPRFTAFLDKIGLKHLLIPTWVDEASTGIEDWSLSMCDAAEQSLLAPQEGRPEDEPVVYSQLRSSMLREAEKLDTSMLKEQSLQITEHQRLEIASEILDHLAAGFDTSGITLTYLAWELSKPEHAEMQLHLREELRTLKPAIKAATDDDEIRELPDAKQIDVLPYLHAIVLETLRLHAAIPGIQPRITPPNATLGPPGQEVHGLPAGVRVNAQAYSLHLNEYVFPEAESWRPMRWLDANGMIDVGGNKARWFWAFSSGGRMCIGNNLAMQGMFDANILAAPSFAQREVFTMNLRRTLTLYPEMKYIVAAIWSNFRSTIVDDTGMVHVDGYTAEPKGSPDGNYLVLRIERI